ncbi:MAG: hypothetical protein MJZ70_01905 [Bacteroidales bacterium]|nr:hypothetical protein [Bacteroidales bacterium]
MKRNLLFFAVLILAAGVFCTSCKEKKVEQPPKIVSFDLQDSALVNDLLCFYMNNDIIPKEAFICDHATKGGMHTFTCLADDVDFCAPDYMQDSLHGTFFQEIGYHQGSSGDNTIYICNKDDKGFHIITSVVGTTNPDLGPQDEFVNGYRVIYYQTDDTAYKLYYDGKKFVSEELTNQPLAFN